MCRHCGRLRRQVESLASVEGYHLGSYHGFEIFAQRQLSRVEGLFNTVEGFLRLPGGQFRYAFSFSDSAQGTLQSIDASLRKLDSHLENALKDQSELRHKREQIEKALSSGWEYAGRYEEFRVKLRQVNQSLRESGSQVDDKQDFAALDLEAFQRFEIGPMQRFARNPPRILKQPSIQQLPSYHHGHRLLAMPL